MCTFFAEEEEVDTTVATHLQKEIYHFYLHEKKNA